MASSNWDEDPSERRKKKKHSNGAKRDPVSHDIQRRNVMGAEV